METNSANATVNTAATTNSDLKLSSSRLLTIDRGMVSTRLPTGSNLLRRGRTT